ncbi:MAG: hypothetical protein D3924_16335 [Candidatus Electrothrix sp. AR4]|nr:hypothetical protein [Candidatus Electrothrix sp. AR4]
MGVYKNGGLKIIPILQVSDEFTDIEQDEWDDNDKMGYGIIVASQMTEDWKFKFFGFYNDDARELEQVTTPEGETSLASRTDRSGAVATLHVDGAAGPVGLAAEVGYKSADVQGSEDDGLGGYIQAAFNLGAVNPVVLAGMTQSGFMADNDFGFVMVGGNECTTVVDVGNKSGDLMFGALVLPYNISDRFSVQGNLLYAAYDYDNDSIAAGKLDSAIEVSAVLGYALSESTSLTYKAGYLTPTYNDGAPDVMEDAYIGQLLRMEVEF